MIYYFPNIKVGCSNQNMALASYVLQRRQSEADLSIQVPLHKLVSTLKNTPRKLQGTKDKEKLLTDFTEEFGKSNSEYPLTSQEQHWMLEDNGIPKFCREETFIIVSYV